MAEARFLSTGPVAPVVNEILGRFGDVVIAPRADEATFASLMPGKIGLIVRGDAQIPARVIEAGRELRVIGRTGVGYDNIDIAAATARRIPVIFTPGVGAQAVAEGAMAMILALAKRLTELDRQTKRGNWNVRFNPPVGDLHGATLGIVGVGRIGRLLARMAAGFDMRVIGYDPYVAGDALRQAGIEPAGLDDLLQQADLVSLHALLNDGTRGLLDRRRLALMKPGSALVNTARGGLFESLDAVYEALQSGRLSGVAMDVFPQEPPDVSHPLFSHPMFLCTPHALGMSVQAGHNIFVMMSEGMAAVLDGKIPEHVVNPEVFR